MTRYRGRSASVVPERRSRRGRRSGRDAVQAWLPVPQAVQARNL